MERNKFGSSVMLGVVLGTSLLVSFAGTGCAKRAVRVGNDPAALAGNEAPVPAAAIDFRILGGETVRGELLPKPGPDTRNGSRSGHILVGDNEVSFADTIPLDDSPLFIVWNEDALGTPIRSADVTHARISLNNEYRRSPNRLMADFDQESRRFFIPLQKALGGDIRDIPPGELQEFTIDLNLVDGSRVTVKLTLRVKTPLAKLQHSFHAAYPGSSDPAALLQGLGRSFILGGDEITNPSGRPLRAWVRNGANSAVQLKASFLKSRYEPQHNKGPAGPFFDPFVSFGTYVPMKAVILRDGRSVKELNLQNRAWDFFDIAPGETVRIRWEFGAIALCDLPPARSREFRWAEAHKGPICHRGECAGPIEVEEYSQTVVEGFQVIGTAVTGGFNREIRIADLGLAGGEATGEELETAIQDGVTLVAPSPQNLNFGAGSMLPDSSPKMECQGAGWLY